MTIVVPSRSDQGGGTDRRFAAKTKEDLPPTPKSRAREVSTQVLDDQSRALTESGFDMQNTGLRIRDRLDSQQSVQGMTNLKQKTLKTYLDSQTALDLTTPAGMEELNKLQDEHLNEAIANWGGFRSGWRSVC